MCIRDRNSVINIAKIFNPDNIIDMGYAPEYMDLLLKLTISDNNGSFIFGGFKTKTQPFQKNIDGVIKFNLVTPIGMSESGIRVKKN